MIQVYSTPIPVFTVYIKVGEMYSWCIMKMYMLNTKVGMGRLEVQHTKSLGEAHDNIAQLKPCAGMIQSSLQGDSFC